MSTELLIILNILTLVVVSYIPLRDWSSRPKLDVYPYLESDDSFDFTKVGFTVSNFGRNIARNVYGEVRFNDSLQAINWENYEFTREQIQMDPSFVDILPGPSDLDYKIFFLLDLREEKKIPQGDISIKLHWEYHG